MLKTFSKKNLKTKLAIALCLMSISPSSTMVVSADTTTQNHALRIVSQYKGNFTSVPTITNTDQTTDAPLLGNGDVGVAILNNIDTMTYILDKNEFWSLNDKHKCSMARMSLSIPGMSGASYSMSEDISKAEVTGAFVKSGNTITTKSWVQADDTTNNRFMTQFTYTGSGTQNVTVSLAPGTDNSYGSSLGSSGNVLYIDVKGDTADTVGGYNAHKARIATSVIGTSGSISGNKLNFTLSSGSTYTLITSIMSNYDSASYQSLAISNINAKTQNDVNAYNDTHHTWWNNFYSKSFVEIPDKVLEKQYYASLYLLASCSRTNEAAPGLWGNWVMKNPGWNGDYTLNYNYEVPFYAAFPTNHTELADSYDKPVIDWVPNAQAEATANGWSGAYYRVHIGPLPNGSNDINQWNQKSCGAYAATDMLMHYYSTRDTAYANKIYNTIKQIAIFWENYLSWDGTRYVILNDAQHEGNANPETNGIMSLGLVRMLLQGCIDISTTLNVDSSERATWQDRLSKLSAFPTFTRNGQTVFRYTEVGLDWNSGNSIGVQHIYPAGQIGLESDTNTLNIAKNMIGQMARWSDDNGTNTFYPAAARVGYDPTTILNNLDAWVNNHTYPNLYIHTGGGGIENFNTVPSTICEMLMQSFQNKIRVFANWPTGKDAKFGDLLAYGSFLVSSDIRNNSVQYMRIISQKGGNLTFKNPWPGQTLRLYRNGIDAGTLSGTDITISTASNDILHIAPDGTSYSSILTMMEKSLSTLNATVASVSDYTSSAEDGSKAIDGNSSTKWCSQSPNSVPGDKWLKLDFGTNKTISRWVVNHASSNGESTTYNTKDFKLQKSSDGTNWSDVDTVTNNTAATTDRNVTTFSARYVRLYITAPVQDNCPYVSVPGDRSNARIYEFNVY